MSDAYYAGCDVVMNALTECAPFHTFSPERLPLPLENKISAAIMWEDLRAQMQLLKGKQGKWIHYSQNISPFSSIYICGSFMIGQWKGSWYLYDYNKVMMISDTVWARVNIMCLNTPLPSNAPNKVPDGVIESLYKVIDDSFEQYGNNIYKGIKSWEPLIYGMLLKKYDPYRPEVTFFDTIYNDAIDDGFEFVKSIKEIIEKDGIKENHLSEIHGFYRHWGHPTVDEAAGCIKIKKIALNRPIPLTSTTSDIMGCIKRQFISSFIQKNGRWPIIHFISSIKNKKLKNMVSFHVKNIYLFLTDILL